jgi:hypothetical protein
MQKENRATGLGRYKTMSDYHKEYNKSRIRNVNEEFVEHNRAGKLAIEALLQKTDKFKAITKKFKQLTYFPDKEDPREVIHKALEEGLKKFKNLYGPRVLIATAPTALTEGSLISASDTEEQLRNENRWEGKVGLILAIGPEAFKYNPRYPTQLWNGNKPQVGDWVGYKTSNSCEYGFRYTINEQTFYASCRIIWDNNIEMSIDDSELLL